MYTVLVVEDEKKIANSIVRNIQTYSDVFSVIEIATDGEKALELIKTKVPNVVITDIHMPVMNGIELIKTLDSTYPDIYKVIISGYDNFAYAQQAIRHKVHDYLLKPVLQSDVHDMLKKAKAFLDVNTPDLEKNNIIVSIDELVSFVILFIESNYTTDLNLKDLVKSKGYNFVYFNRKFQKAKGVSANRYLLDLRLNKALQLLNNSPELSVRKIASMVGYQDSAYFCRVFKSHVGKTPSEIRNMQ